MEVRDRSLPLFSFTVAVLCWNDLFLISRHLAPHIAKIFDDFADLFKKKKLESKKAHLASAVKAASILEAFCNPGFGDFLPFSSADPLSWDCQWMFSSLIRYLIRFKSGF